jgi:hypothetical protein
MLYSVWDWNEQKYHVFEANGERPGQRPMPRRNGPGARGAGQQLESLLSVLPRDAVRVGTSENAKGRVAIHFSSPAVGLGAYTDPRESPLVKSPWLTLGAGFLGIISVYKLLMAVARRF